MVQATKIEAFDEKPPSGGFFMAKNCILAGCKTLLYIEQEFSKTGRKLTIFCRLSYLFDLQS
ncbi:hypothetical protein D7V32_11345 [Acinetobacter tianfuensis]|uniref:Uncharacterized protein n=1 Tax=Acinetobacter tianfuensis TaxID=2419603 RepID=A0A3A8E8L1_9GAMM|nr:hypothetical protein D7V32_11345 [Acinetobacter tianfuensis]